jgi:hypothetical protein
MGLVPMYMSPLHGISTVLGWLSFHDNGFLSCCASLRGPIIAVVQLRLSCIVTGFQRCTASRIDPRTGSFRLQIEGLTEPELILVLASDMSDSFPCRHWKDLGSSSKRSSQIVLHTQQLVVLWLPIEHGGLPSCVSVRLSSGNPPVAQSICFQTPTVVVVWVRLRLILLNKGNGGPYHLPYWSCIDLDVSHERVSAFKAASCCNDRVCLTMLVPVRLTPGT